MKFKFLAVTAAMFLTIGSAHAEISTLVKSVSDSTVQLPSGMKCFVKERTFFGNGGASALVALFEEGGLTVSSEKNVDCTIVVGGTVTMVLNKDNPTFISQILAEWIVNNRDVGPDAEAALQSTSLAQEASGQNKADGVLGETAGASVGATFGLAGAAGGALLGTLFDEKKKGLPAGVAQIGADLKFKDAQGKTHATDVIVYAASTTNERPVDLLRAAVKRVVTEIQAQPEAADNASASAQPPIPNQEVH